MPHGQHDTTLDEVFDRLRCLDIGSPEAEEILVDFFTPRLRAWFGRRMRGPQADPIADADDLTQDALLEILRGIASIELIDPPKLASWIFAVAHSALTAHVRRGKSGKRSVARRVDGLDQDTLPHDSESPDNAVDQSERCLQLRAAIDSLPPDQRDALLLHLDEISHKDIGKRLGRSESAVNNLLSRAKQRLREGLDGGEVEP